MKNSFTGILSKSDRALEAEDRGLVVFSNLSAWQKRAVKAGKVHASEWHHTSAAANRTYYYDLEDFEDLDPQDFPVRKIEKLNQPDLKRVKIQITYQKMIGGFSAGARKRFETVVTTGLDIRKSDNAIIGAGGRRLSSNNDNVEFFYRKPHSRVFKEVQKSELYDLGYKFD